MPIWQKSFRFSNSFVFRVLHYFISYVFPKKIFPIRSTPDELFLHKIHLIIDPEDNLRLKSSDYIEFQRIFNGKGTLKFLESLQSKANTSNLELREMINEATSNIFPIEKSRGIVTLQNFRAELSEIIKKFYFFKKTQSQYTYEMEFQFERAKSLLSDCVKIILANNSFQDAEIVSKILKFKKILQSFSDVSTVSLIQILAVMEELENLSEGFYQNYNPDSANFTTSDYFLETIELIKSLRNADELKNYFSIVYKRMKYSRLEGIISSFLSDSVKCEEIFGDSDLNLKWVNFCKSEASGEMIDAIAGINEIKDWYMEEEKINTNKAKRYFQKLYPEELSAEYMAEKKYYETYDKLDECAQQIQASSASNYFTWDGVLYSAIQTDQNFLKKMLAFCIYFCKKEEISIECAESQLNKILPFCHKIGSIISKTDFILIVLDFIFRGFSGLSTRYDEEYVYFLVELGLGLDVNTELKQISHCFDGFSVENDCIKILNTTYDLPDGSKTSYFLLKKSLGFIKITKLAKYIDKATVFGFSEVLSFIRNRKID